MIDFSNVRSDLIDLIRRSVGRYVKEFPEKKLACFALYADPTHGLVMVCLEPGRANSGDGWKPSPEFSLFDWDRLKYPAWSETYYNESQVVIKTLDRQTLRLDPELDNEEYAKPFFELFFGTVDDMVREKAFESLPRKKSFAVRVEDLYGSWDKEWPWQTSAKPKYTRYNARCEKRIVDVQQNGAECPKCGEFHMGFRCIIPKPGQKAYFICRKCGRSFFLEHLTRKK